MTEWGPEPRPAGVAELDVFAAVDVGIGRLQALLLRFDLPAVIIRDPLGAADRLTALVLCDGMQRPLGATAVEGILTWEPSEPVSFARALWQEYGPEVYLDGEWLDAGEPDEEEAPEDDDPAREPEPNSDLESEPRRDRSTTERLAWTTTEQRDMVPLIARAAGQPLGVVEVDGRRLVMPTSSEDDARNSPAWMASSELLMWRRGDRRGIASYRESRPFSRSAGHDLLAHSWDDEPQTVDPTRGWERDLEGRTVRDYLADLAPAEPGAEEWAERFDLDAEHSERLRVLLRRRGSTADTLSEAAGILGVPPVLAHVVEGRIEQQSLPGYGVVRPASLMSTIRAGLVDHLSEEDGGPLLAWYRFSRRHPRWRFVITAFAIAFLTSGIVVKIAQEDTGTLWIQIVGLVLWVADAALPRTFRSRPG